MIGFLHAYAVCFSTKRLFLGKASNILVAYNSMQSILFLRKCSQRALPGEGIGYARVEWGQTELH